MGEITRISWTDHTFNPWIGCTRVSPGCEPCYAQRANNFFRWNRNGWGPRADRKRTSETNWRKVIQWNLASASSGIRRRIFCASLADIFDDHPSILNSWREDLWALIERTSALDWQLLTKRPEKIGKYLSDTFFLTNRHVWIGTSVENRKFAKERLEYLRKCPAAVRFISYEPAIAPIDFSEFAGAFDWMIVGGESGPGARPLNPDWAISTRDVCTRLGVPFFFKQWGGYKRVNGVWGGDKLEGRVYHEFPTIIHGPMNLVNDDAT